jgi:putative polyhydroxyalkanoate system protein
MPAISLHRKHRLGLQRAREVAWQWAEHAEQKFGMECTVEEGEREDIVHFERSGVAGELRVSAEAFEIDARLGLLLGAFAQTIEAEIEKNLDALLAAERPRDKSAADKKTPKKAAHKAPAKPSGKSPRKA